MIIPLTHHIVTSKQGRCGKSACHIAPPLRKGRGLGVWSPLAKNAELRLSDIGAKGIVIKNISVSVHYQLFAAAQPRDHFNVIVIFNAQLNILLDLYTVDKEVNESPSAQLLDSLFGYHDRIKP